MKLIRLFSTDAYKGTEGYLQSQTIYEGVRTLLLFAVSASLFIAGYLQTHSRANLLTIIAVLGCLPASKSMVSFIMYLRYKGCPKNVSNEIKLHLGQLSGLYDSVFTSYKTNYPIHHLVVVGKTVCGYTDIKQFDEQAFQKHLSDLLKLDGHKDVTVKIFTQLDKYLNRLDQLQELEEDKSTTNAIIATLKSITL